MKEELLLNASNIEAWKTQLNEAMKPYYGRDNYASTCKDEEWLNSYSGHPVQDAVDDELHYSS